MRLGLLAVLLLVGCETQQDRLRKEMEAEAEAKIAREAKWNAEEPRNMEYAPPPKRQATRTDIWNAATWYVAQKVPSAKIVDKNILNEKPPLCFVGVTYDGPNGRADVTVTVMVSDTGSATGVAIEPGLKKH